MDPSASFDHTTIEMDEYHSSSRLYDALCNSVNNVDGPAVNLKMDAVGPILQDLRQELADTIAAMPGNEGDIAFFEKLVDGDLALAKAYVSPNSLNDCVMVAIEESGDFPEASDTSVAAALKRTQILFDTLTDLLGKLVRNEFEGDFGRLLSNVTIASVHTGSIVGILTAARQALGFAFEVFLQSSAASPLTRNVIGTISLMIGPALNTLGAIKDEWDGTANWQTRTARLAMLSLSLAAFAAALTVPQALPLLSSFGPQMGFYSLARDLVQLFVPIRDNSTANLPGTLATGAAYGAFQFLAGTAMDQLAPNSGAGRAMSAGGDQPNAEDTFRAYLSAWVSSNDSTVSSPSSTPESRARAVADSFVNDDIWRALVNAGAEVADKFVGGELMHAQQENKMPEGFRLYFVPPRIPSAQQVVDQVLTTATMRVSFFEAIMGVALSADTYFSSLNLPAQEVKHAVNALVAAVAFAGYPAFVYAHTGNSPKQSTEV